MTTIRTVILMTTALAILGSCAGVPRGTTTALHTAAEAGDVDEVKQLITQEAKVDSRDELGRTALHRAAITGNLLVTAALLDVGADPNLTDMEGRTALHYAVLTCNSDLVAMLLGADADPALLDGDDRSALDLVKETDCPEVADTIRSASVLPDSAL